MGIFKSQEKVLAVAPNYHFTIIWNSDRIHERICNCTFYLHIVLK